MATNKTFLPKVGSPKYEELVKEYPTAPYSKMMVWTAELGYKNVNSFQASMFRCLNLRRVMATTLPPAQYKEGVEYLTEIEQQTLNIVSKGPVSVGEISRQVDRSSETIIKTIDSLRAKHHEVVLDDKFTHQVSIPHTPSKEFKPTEFKYFRKYYRIGIVGDTHIGSKYQQMTLLHDAYSIFDTRLTDFNVHAGDVSDGVGMYRGHRDELFLDDADKQRKHAEKNYPKSKRGTKTYMIGGQHDYCYIKQNGYNIVEHLCESRDDLIYKGIYTAEFKIKGLLVGMEHLGGGLAYALSYAPQKFIEDLAGHVLTLIRNRPADIGKLPAIVIFGHFHKTMHLPDYMGIDVVTAPCFQSRTKYLQQKRHHPDVGCAIAEIWLDGEGNLTSTKIEFINMNSQIKEKDY